MSTVVIRIDGVDVTDDVIFKQASFQSLVNGAPGQTRLRIKDIGQTYDINTGDSLTLDVDSVRVWGGYVTGARKVYALSVIDTNPLPVTRVWEVLGHDYNILFNKRIVWKQSDPTGKLDFKYDADTYDDTIINDIFDNYLTISGDGLTRTGVDRIAKAILDVPGKTHHGSVASASYTWKQMMDRVARATGGVYYISPTKVLTYVDVETSTSSYDLTDTPSDGNDIGYQSFTLLENGSNLVNDMFVWGAGTGSNAVVFSRTEDSSSITAHHRWQLGLFTGGLFRQASADIIADSYVYGTPQSHRGGKDDEVSFTVRVFEPRFTAGQVVDVACGIFDYADALPIRSMTTTFASPTDAIFDLVLGHLIDIPVGIAEFANYIYEPTDDCPPGFSRSPSGQCIPETIEGGEECDCGVTDDFNRPDQVEWGRSTSGAVWEDQGTYHGPVVAVVDGVGSMVLQSELAAGDFLCEAERDLRSWDIGPDFRVSFRFKFPLYPANDVGQHEPTVEFLIKPGLPAEYFVRFEIGVSAVGTGTVITLQNWDNAAGDEYYTIDEDRWYRVRMEQDDGVETRAKIWPEDEAEPSSWTFTLVREPHSWLRPASFSIDAANHDDNETFSLLFDDLTIEGFDRCTAVQFDDFERAVSSGWGKATPGGEVWSIANSGGTQSVGSGMGVMVTGSGGIGDASALLPVWPVTPGDDITLTTLVRYVDTQTPTGSHFRFIVDNVYTIECNENPDTILIKTNGGGTYTYSTSIDLFQWFWIKINISTVAFNVKAWQLGTDEPSAWASGDPSVAFEGYNVVYELREGASSPHLTMNVQSLDLDYDGRPCYLDCGVTDGTFAVFDSFTRTLASTWGTATVGAIWAKSGTGTNTTSVTGTVGRIQGTGFGAFSSGGASMTTTLGAGGTVKFTMPFVLAFDVVALTEVGNRARVGINLQGVGFSPTAFAAIDIYTNDFGALKSVLYTTPSGSVYANGWYDSGAAITSGTVYVACDVNGVTVTNTSNSDALFQPWYNGAHTLISPLSTSFQIDAFAVEAFTAVAGNTIDFQIDNIVVKDGAYYGALCSDVGTVPGGDGVASMGPVCETLDHGAGTIFYTTKAFQPGSLEVWTNGLGTTPSSTDPSVAQFVLSSGIASSDILHVCYIANGDPVI